MTGILVVLSLNSKPSLGLLTLLGHFQNGNCIHLLMNSPSLLSYVFEWIMFS